MQKYIQNVNVQVKGSAKQKGMLTPEEAAAKKKAMKEVKKNQEEELTALFDDALLVGAKRGKAGAQAGKGGTHEAVDDRVRKAQETVVVKEEEKTLEDLIEEQRAALTAQGKKGTPVTEESLAKWKADRKAKQRAEERKLVERKLAEKGKKGLNVLSGRALYDYDSSIFKDDANAVDQEEMQQRVDGKEMQTNAAATTAASVSGESICKDQVADDIMNGVQKDVFLQEDGDDLDDLDDLDCMSDDGESGG